MIETIRMLKYGGAVMIPIGICSLAALAIILERAFALRRSKVLAPKVLALVETYNGSTPDEAALMACRRAKGAFARIIETVLKTRRLDHAQAIETMHATGRTEVGALERGLTALEIVAGISPLLGLLGTVLGMVNVFDAITVGGLGNPQTLSSGISKALVTTVAGLVVAIPALAFHSWFSRRVDDLAAEMQDRATAFLVQLQGQERVQH